MKYASGYIVDPPSVRSTRTILLPPNLVDKRRTMDTIRRGLMPGLPALDCPNDDLLIATLVAHGQPQFSAEQLRDNPTARYFAAMFWSTVQEAAKGNKEAQEMVDVARAAWDEMRKAEVISDRPGHTVGFWER